MIFLVYFPITFTIILVSVWLKLIPNPQQINNALQSGIDTIYNKKDLENSVKARAALKEFVNNLLKYLKQLSNYMDQVKRDKLIRLHYELIEESEEFSSFKELFMKTKHTGLSKKETESLFTSVVDKIETSWNVRIEETSKMLRIKQSDIHLDILKNI